MGDFEASNTNTQGTTVVEDEIQTLFELSGQVTNYVDLDVDSDAAFTTEGSHKDFTEYDRLRVLDETILNKVYGTLFRQYEAATEDEQLVRYKEYLEGIEDASVKYVLFVAELPSVGIAETLYINITNSSLFYYNAQWIPLTSGSGIAENLATGETDTQKVLAPDGNGGTQWVTPSGGDVASYAIFVTNVVPVDVNKRVDVVYKAEPDNEVVSTFTTDDTQVTITIEWDRNANSYVGEPVINGDTISDYDTKDGVTYTKDVTVALGAPISIIFGTNSYLLNYSTYDIPTFDDGFPNIGDYPDGQTEYKPGDIVPINIGADIEFDTVEIDDYGICVSDLFDVTGTLSATVDAIAANKNITNGAAVRVRSTDGVWSDWTLTDGGAKTVNTTIPTTTLTNVSIEYPDGNEALKGTDQANIPLLGKFTDTSRVTINYDDTQVVLLRGNNGGTIEQGDDITNEDYILAEISGVEFDSGTFNVTLNMYKNSNGATNSKNLLVEISDIEPELISTSGVSVRIGETKNVNATFSQPVRITNYTLTTNKGQSSYMPGVSFINSVSIPVLANTGDTPDNSTAYVTIDVVSKSGLTATLSNPYYVRGFVERSITYTYPSLLMSLGTKVVSVGNLVFSGQINTSPSFPIENGVYVTPSSWDNASEPYQVNYFTIRNGGEGSDSVEISEQLKDFGYKEGETITINIEETV